MNIFIIVAGYRVGALDSVPAIREGGGGSFQMGLFRWRSIDNQHGLYNIMLKDCRQVIMEVPL